MSGPAKDNAAEEPPPPPPIVRLVGGGVARPNAESELPLDVQCGRLAEWLVTRGRVAEDWPARLEAIRAKAREAAKDLPPQVLAAARAAALPAAPAPAPAAGPAASGSDANDDDENEIDYFVAVAVRDALASRPEGRNLFGGLAGAAALWSKIVRAYESSSQGGGALHLAEAAQRLNHGAEYGLPALKRQAARLAQAVADAERRGEEQRRQAAAAAAAFARECEAMGVDAARAGGGGGGGGGGVVGARRELRRLAARLPAVFDARVVALVAAKGVDQAADDLWAAAEYYAAVVAYAHPPAPGAAAQAQPAARRLLPTLAEVREGRTKPPARANAAAADEEEEEEEEEEGDDEQGGNEAGGGRVVEVDWGAMLAAGMGEAAGAAAEAGGGGGGGGATAGEGKGGGGISWGAAEPKAGGDGDGAAGQAAADAPEQEVEVEMPWKIEVEGEGEEAGQEEQGQPAAAAAADAKNNNTDSGGGQASAAARRLVRDADYRARLADDLHELRAFLVTRLSELSSDGASSAAAAALPEPAASVDAARCGRMLAAAEAALAALSDPSARRLLRLASSRAHLEHQAAALARRGGQEGRLLQAAREAAARQAEARAALAEAAPRVTAAAARLRALKARTEAELAKLLGGRRVNLQGEINKVLAGT